MVSIADPGRAIDAADRAFADMDVDAVVAHLSVAIQGFTAAGEPSRAAMACLRLGEAFANLLGNPTAARAWFTRAQRLVQRASDESRAMGLDWVGTEHLLLAIIGEGHGPAPAALTDAGITLDTARTLVREHIAAAAKGQPA